MTEKELPKGKGRRPKLMGISESNAALRASAIQPAKTNPGTINTRQRSRQSGNIAA